jgi:hypothetical protein
MSDQEILSQFLSSRRLSGLFHHCVIAQELGTAGFQVTRVEKLDNHAQVWIVKMWRWRVPRGYEIQWAKQWACQFLKRQGVKCPKREICVVVQGDRIKVAFNWEGGAGGQIVFTRRKLSGPANQCRR